MSKVLPSYLVLSPDYLVYFKNFKSEKCANIAKFVFYTAIFAFFVLICYFAHLNHCEIRLLRTDSTNIRRELEMLKTDLVQTGLIFKIQASENNIDLHGSNETIEIYYLGAPGGNADIYNHTRNKRDKITATVKNIMFLKTESYLEMKKDKRNFVVVLGLSDLLLKAGERNIYQGLCRNSGTRIPRKSDVSRTRVIRSNEKYYQEHLSGPESSAFPHEVHNLRNRRRNRTRSNLESMDERHRPSAKRFGTFVHFQGDSSKYVYGKHQHYKGNGHLAHPQGHYVDWIASPWTKSLGLERHVGYSDGVWTVNDTGLYFIYAQIFYVDEHDINGYRIYRNEFAIAQCTAMTHGAGRLLKENTCYTATVEYLYDGDKLALKDISTMRYSVFEAGKSFFGFFKLSDMKIK